jgi:hypothetical protein
MRFLGFWALGGLLRVACTLAIPLQILTGRMSLEWPISDDVAIGHIRFGDTDSYGLLVMRYHQRLHPEARKYARSTAEAGGRPGLSKDCAKTRLRAKNLLRGKLAKKMRSARLPRRARPPIRRGRGIEGQEQG